MPKKRLNEFQLFYDSARHNDVLDERTTIMLHLGTAMAVACYP
jgi:hypothetical protein